MGLLDAGLLAMESRTTPMHIGGIQIFRPPRGAGAHYVTRLHRRLLQVPVASAPFNYRYAPSRGALGLPAWEEVEVDTEEHVFRHALSPPGTRAQLMELVSELDHGLLDRSRPLWQHHLIEGLEDGCFAAFTRVHHAIVDGQWGIRLMRATVSPDPRERGLPPFWAVSFDGGRPPGEAAASAHGQRARAGHPLADLLAGLAGSGAALRSAFERTLESWRHPVDGGLAPIYSAPPCMLNGPLTDRRALAVVALDLGRIQALAKAHDATLNEIVLTLCGGALREYLRSHDDLPGRPLIANVPVAVARRTGQVGGNALASAFVALATQLADPVERFAAIRSGSREAKRLVRELPPAALAIYAATTVLPFIVAQALGRAEAVRAQTLVVSNIAGAREQHYMNGAAVVADYPLSLLVPGQAMNITVVSRVDRLDVAVLVCPDLAPGPDTVARGMERALDELERALARPPARASRARRQSARPSRAPR